MLIDLLGMQVFDSWTPVSPSLQPLTSGKPKGVKCTAGHPVAQWQREGGSGFFVPKPWVNYSFDSGA